MKRTLGLAVIPFICLVLTGCGGEIIRPVPPPDVTTGTGNWFIYGYYKVGVAIAPYSFGGSIVNNNGQLSGFFHIDQICFDSGATDVPYTGAVDSKNNVSITSSTVAGQVLKLTGTLSADGSALTQANFSITGGCTGNITSATIPNGPGTEFATTAYRVPELTGGWTAVAGRPLNISEQLSQAKASDGHGYYALSGTVSVQGSPCFTHGVLQPPSFVSGTLGHERIAMDDGSVIDATLVLGYGEDPSAKPELTLDPGTITGGQCNGPVAVWLR
jgi:hypothetical protein